MSDLYRVRRAPAAPAAPVADEPLSRADGAARLRVRLFGGFEIWAGDRQVGRFESQKVRALLAYLVCHRGRSLSRDHLAGLLWPESSGEGARQSLRQAVYNLRSKLPGGGSAIRTSHLELCFDPEGEVWLDVEAFEEALRQGASTDGPDPHHLSAAAQLYRGDFLSGFFVKECPEFEDWMLAEQARLREAAIEALRTLIESYRRRGEYRFGIHYARRLVAIEPLSEAAHRELMWLSALAGRRSSALAHYGELKELLRRELGIGPMEETRALHAAILAEAAVESASPEDGEPIGPLIPLAGRREAWEVLRECWGEVTEGSGRLTLVEGEAGVGKSRLIKSFLDAAVSRGPATVLEGRGYELAPPVAFLPFVEAIRNAVAAEAEIAAQALASTPVPVLADVALLCPDLHRLRPDLPAPAPLSEPAGRRGLFDSVAQFLLGLCRGGSAPLVLFLDDLHLADRATFDLLAHLLPALAGNPIWILAGCRTAGLEPDHPLTELARRAAEGGALTRLALDRLPPAAVGEIAAALVGEGQGAELSGFLARRGAGLPLAIAELINALWDDGVLATRGGEGWSLTRSPGDLDLPPPGDHVALALRRIRRLPSSTRRLVTLAAVAGQSFEAGQLQVAAEEHPTVVDVGLEILLKRWFIRRTAHWTSGRREHDIVLWEQGARRGSFEFAHKSVRSALYADLDPRRRQAMHAQLAAVLEQLPKGPGEPVELLAYHLMAAGLWERALGPLERASERAQGLLAHETALHYRELAREALDRLRRGAGGAGPQEPGGPARASR